MHSPAEPDKQLTAARILQEPSPLTLAATHLTLKKHFDMDELFQHIVSTDGNRGKTKVTSLFTYAKT